MRRYVNSGKMVQPYRYRESPLLAPDTLPATEWKNAPALGSKLQDLACTLLMANGESRPAFLRSLVGDGLLTLIFPSNPKAAQAFIETARSMEPNLPNRIIPVFLQAPTEPVGAEFLLDTDGSLQQALDGRAGSLYLIRPDGHLAARRRNADAAELASLVCQACGFSSERSHQAV
jgi:3-(3-hydroxy-phenyl)propionate hydroxylase